MHVLWFVLALIVTGLCCFIGSAIVMTFIAAGSQQKKDWIRYGRSSSRWQIMLEIWKIREVK